jgi:Uma2 family endonuclease
MALTMNIDRGTGRRYAEPSMSSSASTQALEHERADQRLIMLNVPWSGFEAQLALRGEAPVPRVAYLDGALELMSPSVHHERLKSNIGCLIETFALERGIDLQPCGGWTLRNAPKAAGLEPDECYVFGNGPYPERPDLAIEVIWTHGGIDKLEIYRRLGVPEVWFWRDDALVLFALRGEHYEEVAASALLPGLDVALFSSFLDRVPVTQAIRAYREALQR